MGIDNLRARRVKMRLSQYIVAKIAGLTRNRLSILECGYSEATFEEVKQIFEALEKLELDIKKSPYLIAKHFGSRSRRKLMP